MMHDALSARDLITNHARLMRRARSMVGAGDAEDVVQETFERALRTRSFRPATDPRPWLNRIAFNVACDTLRRRARYESFEIVDDAVESTEHTVLRRETALDIGSALEVLPRVQRRTIVLHDFQGYSNTEIAAIDGISLHTVRTRLSRARHVMRTKLAHYAR